MGFFDRSVYVYKPPQGAYLRVDFSNMRMEFKARVGNKLTVDPKQLTLKLRRSVNGVWESALATDDVADMYMALCQAPTFKDSSLERRFKRGENMSDIVRDTPTVSLVKTLDGKKGIAWADLTPEGASKLEFEEKLGFIPYGSTEFVGVANKESVLNKIRAWTAILDDDFRSSLEGAYQRYIRS